MTTQDCRETTDSKRPGLPSPKLIWRGCQPHFFGLHGFTGGPGDYSELAKCLGHHFTASHLLGHGPLAKAGPTAFEIDAYANFIVEAADSSTVLIGYSMGARVAIDTLVRKKHRPKALVLISGTAGISAPAEREARYQKDIALAHQLTELGVDEFLKLWNQTPLISTQSNASVELQKRMSSIRKKHTAVGLAYALKTLSPGRLPSRWNELHQLTLPVLLITGRLDTKYDGLAEKLRKQLPNATRGVIDTAGHAPHIEAPGPTANLIRRFVASL
ncbi:MAG: alpha/beta fold hydrolase [Myxococcota bacterium]|nr:alpha/beta fold hydrolase [Myxococcota bacterium]